MTELLTRKEAADRLGISLTTLDLERTEGRLSFIQTKPNGKVWIPSDSIEAYLGASIHKAMSLPVTSDTLRKRRVF